MPVVVLFYQGNGMGMQEIFTLKAIYSVAIVALEVPSGWMADVWGRKRTLLFGSLMGFAGFFTYSFAYGFWAFAFAEIILGAGHAFVSGADSAMLYDSLKADNKAGNYLKHEGRITSAGNFGEALAGVAGGLLAAYSLRMPFYAQTLVAAIAIPAAFLLAEPKIHSVEHIHSLKKMYKNIRSALINNQPLRESMLISALTGAATLTFAWLVQPFFIAIGVHVELYGILWTALNLTVGISSVFAHRAGRFINSRFMVPAIVISITAGYLLAGFIISWLGISFLFLFYLVRGVATPMLKYHLHQYTSSDVRATILSVRDFSIRLIFAIIGPALGWLTDHVNLQSAFIIAGGFYLITAFLVIGYHKILRLLRIKVL